MIGRFRRGRAEKPSPETVAIVDRFVEAARSARYRMTPELAEATDAILEATPERQRELLLQLVAISPQRSWDIYTHAELCQRLVQRKLPWTEPDLVALVEWSRSTGPLGHVLKAVERRAATEPPGRELTAALRAARQSFEGWRDRAVERRLDERIGRLLGETATPQLALDVRQPVGRCIRDDVNQLVNEHRDAMQALLVFAQSASGSKPSKKWMEGAEPLLAAVPDDLFRAALLVWFAAFDEPSPPNPQEDWKGEWWVADVNADLLKGLAWVATIPAPDDELIRAIGAVGLAGQRKIPGLGPRCDRLTNAAVWALSAIDDGRAIGQLAILRARIRNRGTQKQIDKAMGAVADRLGITAEEVEELAVPTYGFTKVGVYRERLGDFTASLVVSGATSTTLAWFKPDGTPQKTVPKAVKDEHAEALQAIKATKKDVEKFLPSQRDRLDRLHLSRTRWPFATWVERYRDQPIVGPLARRLIWEIVEGDVTRAVTWLDDANALVDVAGSPIEIDGDRAEVGLWHPIGKDESSIAGWRSFFEEREIRQPFKQAHREVYPLTDAERTTNVYSNRFAAHLVKQHQFNALCAVRGWRNQLRLLVDAEYEPATLELPEWGLRAEFWVDGAGDEFNRDTNETGTFLYLATDQVRFYPHDARRLSAHAGGGGYGTYGAAAPEPVPLEEIPPLVLSEVLRDVDLFVGVASVGNDPAWMDGGRDDTQRTYWESYAFGDLTAAAATRRAQLTRLVPRLKIADRCTFSERFLHVRGERRSYKIHLGSGNILMEPNDQYLCIVPGRGAVSGPAANVFLPFEGDRTLSIILSKAFLLAEDARIKDPTILSQIGR